MPQQLLQAPHVGAAAAAIVGASVRRLAKHRIADSNTSQAVKPGHLCARLGDGEGLDLLLFAMGGAHGWRFANSIGGQR